MNVKSILSALFFLFCLFTQCSQNVSRTNTFPESAINFLNIDQGKVAILDETYEPYFSQLQKREVHVFTGIKPPSNDITEIRSFAKEKFASAVIPFSEDEKECITFVISRIKATMNRHNINLVANHPWRFIKIEDWLCGGFAHTRGNSIILSQKHLEKLMVNWSQSMNEKDENELVSKFGALLVHEQLHSLQRSYKSKFDSLYRDFWGFIPLSVEPNKAIAINQVSNPDAPNLEWAFEENDNYYWVRTLIKEHIENPKMGRDFIDCVYQLEYKNGNYSVKEDSLGSPISFRLARFKNYTNRFPVSNGLDHPNEISAYMFSQYFVSLYNNSTPFEDQKEEAKKTTKVFIKWIKQHLK